MSEHSPKRIDWRHVTSAALQGIVAGLVLAGVFTAGFFYRDLIARPPRSETSFALLNEVEGVLQRDFLYEMPGEPALVYGAARGLVSSLNNQYTYFVEPEAAEVDEDALSGRFGGIGAEITRDEAGQFVIARVYRDNPAYEAGVQAGDIIVAVDGVTVDPAAPDMDDVLAAIRGEIGEPVTLTLSRGGQTFDVEIVRAELLIPSTFWRVLEEDPQIGYIQVTRFTGRTPDEVDTAIAELEASEVEAYVLDLRDNGGGLVDSAVSVVSEFLNGGVVLYEQRRDTGEQVFNASRGGSALEAPLVVLVNAGTASASEIVAAAIQDNDRGILIGQQTFGKGSVQLIRELSDGSSLHVTTAEWYTPDHNRIEGQGLVPTIEVAAVEGQDAPLQNAVTYLSGVLSGNDAE